MRNRIIPAAVLCAAILMGSSVLLDSAFAEGAAEQPPSLSVGVTKLPPPDAGDSASAKVGVTKLPTDK